LQRLLGESRKWRMHSQSRTDDAVSSHTGTASASNPSMNS
jgi:hypothetical protein